MNNLNIIIAGVGGQGILLTSKILSHLALINNFDVKVSEVHGMAQRGGSVVTFVKIGNKIHSPTINIGEGNFLLAFEELEALRWVNHLKKDSFVIINKQQINPMSVISGNEKYPSNITKLIRQNFYNYCEMDCLSIAKECGNVKTVNTILLGVMANFLTFNKNLWMQALKESIPENFFDINLKAFQLGYKKLQVFSSNT